MTFKQRAITDEQKEERRQTILDSARHLFQENTFKSLSMAQIATHAGIAKGTIFIYFKTKEELFLALTLQEYQKCFKKINDGLNEYLNRGSTCSIEEFIDILRIALVENKVKLRLIAINNIIQENVDYVAARQFNMFVAEQVKYTSRLMEQAIPFLRPGEGRIILIQLEVLAIGIQHFSDPAPIVNQVIDMEQLEIFRIDFSNFFCLTMKALLTGLEARES